MFKTAKPFTQCFVRNTQEGGELHTALPSRRVEVIHIITPDRRVHKSHRRGKIYQYSAGNVNTIDDDIGIRRTVVGSG